MNTDAHGFFRGLCATAHEAITNTSDEAWSFIPTERTGAAWGGGRSWPTKSHWAGPDVGVDQFSAAFLKNFVLSPETTRGSGRIASLNSAKGTCAFSHFGSREICSMDAWVLLQIK